MQHACENVVSQNFAFEKSLQNGPKMAQKPKSIPTLAQTSPINFLSVNIVSYSKNFRGWKFYDACMH